MPLLWIVVAVIVLLAWKGDGDPIDGALTAVNELSRGPRLTHSPADSAGLVTDDPQDLADEAGYSLESYAGGRMLASEEGTSDTTTQAAVVWSLINHANAGGKGLADVLLAANNPRNRGHFGSQKDKDPSSAKFGKSDRYASTALDPYDRDCMIVQQCLDGTIADLTGGATNFDRVGGESDPNAVASNRQNSGLVAVDVPGADSGLRFWRPA